MRTRTLSAFVIVPVLAVAVALGTPGIAVLLAILAAIGGGWISARMDDTLSNVLFACLLVVVAVRLLLEVRNSH